MAIRLATHFDAKLWYVRWSLFSFTLLTLMARANRTPLVIWSIWEDEGLLTSGFLRRGAAEEWLCPKLDVDHSVIPAEDLDLPESLLLHLSSDTQSVKIT